MHMVSLVLSESHFCLFVCLVDAAITFLLYVYMYLLLLYYMFPGENKELKKIIMTASRGRFTSK